VKEFRLCQNGDKNQWSVISHRIQQARNPKDNPQLATRIVLLWLLRLTT